tara:strand:+ start:5651 stop:5917 length:267 start_codon:yes stop_codon:yes gene_type:complete
MKVAILLLLRNFGAALLTQHMVMFMLRLATNFTDNKIDDNVVGLIDAGFDNDVPAMKSYLEALSREVKEELDRQRLEEEEKTPERHEP